jgi:PAS domain S-box-containing protein
MSNPTTSAFRKGIRFKLFLNQNILSLLLFATVIFFIYRTLNKELTDYYRENSVRQAAFIESEFSRLHKVALKAGKWFENSTRLQESMRNNARYQAVELGKTIVDAFGLHYFTVTDSVGNVFFRDHTPDLYGDNIANQVNVQKALQGESTVGIEPGRVVLFSIRAGRPLRNQDGGVMGAITTGFVFNDTRFVDDLKNALGSEVSIIINNELYQTTLTNNQDERLQGYAFQYPEIEQEVMQNGSTWYGNINIDRQNYASVILPITGVNGQVIGMLHSGSNTNVITNLTFGIIRNVSIAFLVLLGLMFFFLAFILNKSVIRPVKGLLSASKIIAKGNLNHTFEVNYQDEMGELAKAINNIRDRFLSVQTYLNQIESGNLDVEIEKEESGDSIFSSVHKLKESLKIAKQEEIKRKVEDQKRTWATEGMAIFSDLLRKDNENIEVLSYNIVKQLVKYLKCNQGGLFLLNDEDKNHSFLELRSCYAYDRRKYLTREIELGEGLVGACFLEKKTIYLKKLPENYIQLTSGLGDAPPDFIIIVPLKLNEEVYGVIELASFHEFSPHEIEFAERIAESIASTMASVKTNIRTAQLLKQSQQQAEEMRSQEEEMRQNMEEMQATQEEMGRKEAELTGLLKTINDSYLFAEFDTRGTVVSINDNFLKLFGINRNEIMGTNHSEFDKLSQEPAKYKEFWEDLLKGKIIRKDAQVLLSKKEIWLSETYSPLIEKDGVVTKILLLAADITEVKLNEKIAEQLKYDMGERLKELTGISSTIAILQKNIMLEEKIQYIASLLPPAWQYPEDTVAEININGNRFVSKADFKGSKWDMSQVFHTKSNKKGEVKIYYTKEYPVSYEGPFLREERELINNISFIIKTYMDSHDS